MRTIEIRGARTHHLKDLSLDLPREAWTVVCGVSGSGKSSLVLDTLGAESYRRFLGTLSRGLAAEALSRPDVDRIEGLPPAVAAGFLSRAPGPRETMGTVTEVHDGLRVLFARAAVPHCPTCGRSVRAVSPEKVISDLLAKPEGTKVVLLTPRGRGPAALAAARKDGFVRARIGGRMLRLDDAASATSVTAAEDESVEVVVDRLVVRPDARSRFADSVDQGFRAGDGVLHALIEKTAGAAAEEASFADRPFCPSCGIGYPALSPSLFSFNGPTGACPACQGLGTAPRLDPERLLPRDVRLSRARARAVAAVAREDRPGLRRSFARAMTASSTTARDLVSTLSEEAREALLGNGTSAGLLAKVAARGKWEAFAEDRVCDACKGSRLAPFPSAAKLAGHTLPALLDLPASTLERTLAQLPLEKDEGVLARPARDDVVARLRFLEEVGLGYLEGSRAAAALSGGELRRARLAAACAARMSGLLFLLDEPTMGLHPADRAPLRRRLRTLVAEGNTVICVEHDPHVLREADHVVELGPGAGAAGGRILAEGPARRVIDAAASPMAKALAARPTPPRSAPRKPGPVLRLKGAHHRNLRNVSASFPLGGLTCVTGVSGAGKSTLVLDVLAPAARAVIARAPFPKDRLVALEGMEGFDRVSVSDGAPSRHARSSAGSVLGVLGRLRDLFAATVEARSRGFRPVRFSTNVKGGRCEACQGLGVQTVRLRHLPDLTAPCDACAGKRFRPETLEVRVKGLSIADALDLPLSRAAEVFRDLTGVGGPLKAAADVGLGYVPLGEATERLSGGEGLRLRLAAALGRAGRSKTLYLLDEPCAGLHPSDVAQLSAVLLRLAAEGDTVIAVEHHPDLVRQADHVVDLGPGPGDAGGRLVIEGPPAAVAACSTSRTGASLG